MELEAIRKFVQDHPDGVVIRMIDGTRLVVPHRDFISFGAPKEMLSGKQATRGTSFVFFETGDVPSMRPINAMLVAEVMPLERNGNGKHGKGRSKKNR
ncbi:hypothetical protein PHYC_00041 [Phycisphaerales bacterium]|nr:hypothetical protein PHYC_00041 [Phycisphaerales bacterium]